MVRRGEAEPDEFAAPVHGHAKTDVGLVRGTVVRRVVHDHVAVLEAVAALFKDPEDATHIPRHRPQLQGRGERALADLAALRVEQRRTEVLGLADDRGVRHAGQLVAHLERDPVEGAGDHPGGDRVDLALPRGDFGRILDDVDRGGGGCHSSPQILSRTSPVSSTWADAPGGTITVESVCTNTDEPSTVAPTGSRSRS